MKGFKIYLTNYIYKHNRLDIKTGETVVKDKTYKVREALANILCNPQLKLEGYEFYKSGKLGDKILSCKKDYIILSHEEYEKTKNAVDTFNGFTRNDAELVSRIYEAEQIDLEVKNG